MILRWLLTFLAFLCGAAVKVKALFACKVLLTSVVFSEIETFPGHAMFGKGTEGFYFVLIKEWHLFFKNVFCWLIKSSFLPIIWLVRWKTLWTFAASLKTLLCYQLKALVFVQLMSPMKWLRVLFFAVCTVSRKLCRFCHFTAHQAIEEDSFSVLNVECCRRN